ncbi:MAG: tyrosine-type recombinase/integrase [Candidatus Krumholzibacteria bacterium]|nr:tyrosine-type recombinase/integrase [Candidatus Krumholzibacteria bacterium]
MPKKHQYKDSEFALEPPDIRKVINAASTLRDRCILKLFAHTGIRREELASLDVRDLDFAARRIHIREGKGAKARTVPITDELRSDLQLYVAKRKIGPLFLSNHKRGISIRQLNRLVHDTGERAGVENPNPKYTGLTPHLFRHSFARAWKKRGLSIESLSKILGHSSVTTTWDLYGSESFDDVQENYDRLMVGE